MPSAPTKSKRKRREPRDEPQVTHCRVCNDPFSLTQIRRHEEVCRAYKRSRQQLERDTERLVKRKKPGKGKKTPAAGGMPQLRLTKTLTASQSSYQGHFPRPNASPEPVKSPDFAPFDEHPPSHSDNTMPVDNNVEYGPPLPPFFLLTIPHPRSHKMLTIVPLDDPPRNLTERTLAIPINPHKPYAPFPTYADYRMASKCVRNVWSDRVIQNELDEEHEGIYNGTAGECRLTIRTVKHMADCLAAARTLTVEFQRTTISVDFTADAETDRFRKTFEVEIDFRDPWDVIQNWCRDPTLAPRSTWFSVRKYLCRGGPITGIVHQEEVYDEPWTGRTWNEVDDELPEWDPEGKDETKSTFPQCYLPLHIWLDKGQVSTKVKKHPILIRALWIDSAIRNGNGNGGSALLGYIVMPDELKIDTKSLTNMEKDDLSRVKSAVYNQINSVILDPVRRRSRSGSTLRCGDGVQRTGIPGILIQSMDFQEIAAWLAMRSAQANFPCPNDTKTDRETILRSKGIHNIEPIQWDFQRSCPYKAVSYDTLHWDEGGKFGRHLWNLIKQTLAQTGKSEVFDSCMAAIPRWRGFDRIKSATTLDYVEGNTHLQLLKLIVPCLVHLLPRNSPLIHALRALQQFRMLVGLHCNTESRLKLMDRFVKDYEMACRGVEGKNFDFLKQHYTQHASGDIREKGATHNMTTRTGEGFQQDVTRHFNRTNGRDAEKQMVVVDANEETMAYIDMVVADDAERVKRANEEAKDGLDQIAESVHSDAHWRLSAPETAHLSMRFETERFRGRNEPDFEGFDLALRKYLAETDPANEITSEQIIKVQSFRGVYLHFQNKADWSPQHDILHCSPLFHGEPRYDCLLFNTENNPHSLARLISLLRITTPNKDVLDLAYVWVFKEHRSWKPKTVWKGCRVVEESARPQFLPLEHVDRGALLARASGPTRNDLHFPLDTVDDDMFLRLNDID
ncbi:hypothetical protein B0H14DRAFT_3511124 [Mycena olivaceomarginata]|nr:hypothetical protein B0H14DRAFT_3511124 [Mycena olivaceomarginata]